MLGLFGTLDLGRRSLQTQQQGMEVTAHNLANVNQSGYARQRLVVETSSTVSTLVGPQGDGVDAVGIEQVRNALLDGQVVSENSVSSSLSAQQNAMEMVQSALGQQVDQSASDTQGTSASSGIAGQTGLTDAIAGLFTGFQDVATQPTQPEARQGLLVEGQNLAARFQQVNQRLADVRGSLNESIKTDVGSANDLLNQIAQLNQQIANAEQSAPGSANDLRDSRQQKLESLANLVKIDTTDDGKGGLNITIAGATVVTGGQVSDTLEAYDTGGGEMGVRTKTGATPLTLTGGSIQGTMETRDVDLAKLQSNLDNLASSMITEVNAIHSKGFSPTGTTGANFFTGTNAATITVNQTLLDNPNLIQASGSATASGDNSTALSLAQLGGQNIAALGGLTFSQSFAQSVTAVGQTLDSLNSQSSDSTAVQALLARQRDSVSGVSLDEEMTQLIQYQKAFQASAKLINTVDQMLDTVISLKS